MHGGFLRFQAQYLRRLRRLRLPAWQNVPTTLRHDLIAAAEAREAANCNQAAFKLYGFTVQEKTVLGAGRD